MLKVGPRSVFSSLDGCVKLLIRGKKLSKLDQEAGGHRIQRVPPTEKRGRVHTSSVTVAVTDPSIKADQQFDKISDKDFKIEWFSGTGAGGQHRNRKKNSCRVIHIPTGIVESRQGRKREGNLRDAKEALLRKLEEAKQKQIATITGTIRSSQIGTGLRGDHIRTYNGHRDDAVDHRNDKRVRLKKLLRGEFNRLWN